jgi:phosphomannomutase
MEHMIKANNAIFKAYDIRGIYGTDFDESFAAALANKVGVFLKAKTMVVGQDARPSSKVLVEAVAQGLREAGVDVLMIGECSTPLFYHAVNLRNADGGIMVTASHNAEQFNGFKVVGRGGAMLGGTELQHIFEDTAPVQDGAGALTPDDVRASYAQVVVDRSGFKKHDMVIGVQAPSVIMPTLQLISDATGITFVQGRTEGLHVEFDDDADRIVFYQDQQKIEPEFITTLLAEKLKFKTVVHDFRYSRGAREVLKRLGITTVMTRVGRLFVHQAMKEHDAEFGGEISGHFFFKSFGYLEASECTMLTVLKIVVDAKLPLADMVASYRTWAKAEEMKLPLNPQAFVLLEEKFSDGTITKLDGLTVEYDDWWFNLRASNTEPVMRLTIEAKTKDLLDQKTREVLALAQAHQVV